MKIGKTIEKILSAKSSVKGFLDGIDGTYVIGWAWNPDKPEERLKVIIYANGEPVAEGLADIFREDLLEAGIGDGKHSFKIKLPERLNDGQEYIIKAKVENYETFINGELKYSFESEEGLTEIDKLMLEEFDHNWFKQTYGIQGISSKIGLFRIYKELVKTHQVSPNPEFNEKLYLLRYKDIAEAVKKGDVYCGFAHYVAVGKKEGRIGSLSVINELDLKGDLNLMQALFDEKWYCSTYKEVNEEIKKLNITPFEHYIRIGIKRKYSPNHWFDEKFYTSFYEDVGLLIKDGAFLNGLEHYIKIGRKEGRIPRRKHFDIMKFKFAGAIEPIGIGEVNSLEAKLSDIPIVFTYIDEPRINFFLPTFDTNIMFGGYISMVEIIKKIKTLGFNMRFVICEDGHMSEDYFWYNLENLMDINETDKDRISFVNLLRDVPIEISENDIFIAYSSMTALTAYNIAKNLKSKKRVIYLIQEDERIFYTNNSFMALIDYVYSLPLVFLFNTKELYEYFKQKKIGPFKHENDAKVYWFDPPINDVEKPTEKELLKRTHRKLLFYARPEAHAGRNLFSMGIVALKRAIEKGYFDDSWSFHGIGSAKDYKVSLSKGKIIDIRSKMNLEEYKKELKNYDVGLFLMYAPHPGLVGFEMASAGMVVVVNSFDYRDESYFMKKSKNFVVAEPNPDALAEALKIATIKAKDAHYRLQNIYKPEVKSWDDALPTNFIIEILKAGGLKDFAV